MARSPYCLFFYASSCRDIEYPCYSQTFKFRVHNDMTPPSKLNRKFTIFSKIVWSISLITTAYLMIGSITTCTKIILSNLLDWRPFGLPIPPIEADDPEGSWVYGLLFGLIFLCIFFINFILSLIYPFLVKKFHRGLTIRAFVPLSLNLTILLLTPVSSDWTYDLDLQTNWKRQEVVQMLEKREVRATIAKSFDLYEGRNPTYSRDMNWQKVMKLPSQNFRVSIELAPAYQHLIRAHDSLQAICQNNILSIYFPMFETSFFDTTFGGWLYQSKDTEPKMFGDERLQNVEKLQEHWYQIDYQHSFN